MVNPALFWSVRVLRTLPHSLFLAHLHCGNEVGAGRIRGLGSINDANAAFFGVLSTSVNACLLGRDTRCYFNVRSKANMSQLNLPHGTDN